MAVGSVDSAARVTSNFGIPDPQLARSVGMPEYYRQSIKGKLDPDNLPSHYLAREWSPQATVDPTDSTAWHTHVARAERRLDAAMEVLRKNFNTPRPFDKSSETMEFKLARSEARNLIDAYMNHDPKDPNYLGPNGQPRNQVPRWQPSDTPGTFKLHPDDAQYIDEITGDAKKASQLLAQTTAQEEMETVLFRVAADHVERQHWTGVDDAATRINSAVKYLNWGNDPNHKPDLVKAYETLRKTKHDLQKILSQAGDPSKEYTFINRLRNKMVDLTPHERRMVIGGAIAGAALIAGGVAAKIAFSTTD